MRRTYMTSCCFASAKDAQELQLLVDCLQQQHGSQGVIIVGYSTGSQITVRYMQQRAAAAAAADERHAGRHGVPILGTVLQAAISDRQYLFDMEGMPELAVKAAAMVAEGRGEDICGRCV